MTIPTRTGCQQVYLWRRQCAARALEQLQSPFLSGGWNMVRWLATPRGYATRRHVHAIGFVSFRLLRTDARLSLGNFPCSLRRGRTVNVRDQQGVSPSWQTFPASTAPTCGVSSSPSCNGPRRWSIKARHLGLTCPSVVLTLRNVFQVNGRVGAATSWHVYCCIDISCADGRKRPMPSCSAAREISTIRESWAPSTKRTRIGWHSHVHLFSPTCDGKFQSFSRWPRRASSPGPDTRFMLMEEAHPMYVGESGVRPRHSPHVRSHAYAQ